MEPSKTRPARSSAREHAKVEFFSFAGMTWHAAPIALFLHANNYLEAAKVAPAVNERFAPAKLFLVCHSIELFLKCFLNIKGFSLKTLRENYGHDLVRLLETASGSEFSNLVLLDSDEVDAIKLASQYYQETVFSYPALFEALQGLPRTPPIEPLLKSANKMAQVLEQASLDSQAAPRGTSS